MSVKSCASRADVESVLQETTSAYAANAAHLRELCAKSDPRKMLAQAVSERTGLRTVLDDAAHFTTITQEAALGSGAVASSVREAESIAGRAEAARIYVEDTLRLKRAIADLYSAIDSRDWERAARAARTALDVPDELVNSEFAAKMVPTAEIPDLPAQSLRLACDDLAALFAREFDKGTDTRNMELLTRYFKLFPLIGHEQQGLRKYSRFICGIISSQSRSLLTSRSQTEPKLVYGAATARLFENIASILSQHSPLVERYYGEAAMAQVVSAIQNEVDAQEGLIIDTWWDEVHLDRLLGETKSYSYPVLVAALSSGARANSPMVDSVDMTEASTALNELTTILNRWYLYQEFIAQRWPDGAQALQQSALARKVSSTLAPAFSTLAVFVFRRSVEMAVDIDELPDIDARSQSQSQSQSQSPDSLITSMVEDTMYVLSTLLDQVLDIGNPEIYEAVIPMFRRILESDYSGTIQRKLQDNLATNKRLASSLEQRTQAFILYLNDLAATGTYVDKVVDRLRDSHPGLFDPEQDPPSALVKLRQSFDKRANDILIDNLNVLFTNQISAQLRSACGSSFKGNYLMSPTEPESDKGKLFEYQWRKIFSPLQRLLHPRVYNQLVGIAAGYVSRILEKWLWGLEGKVNELGSIALDRDVSKIIATVSEDNYAVRDKFIRVAQIVSIIGEEEDIETVLTDTEILEAKKLRI